MTEGNEDEAEVHDHEGPGREGRSGHPAQDATFSCDELFAGLTRQIDALERSIDGSEEL